MDEHYCPICRAELSTNNHLQACPIGNTMAGQGYVLDIRAQQAGRVLAAEFDRMMRVVNKMMGRPA